MKKILILGASGMAGHIISTYLSERGHDIFTFSRLNFNIGKNIIGDILSFDFKEHFNKNQYDIVINCIGILNTHCDENISNAIYINSYFPNMLRDLLNNTPTKLIQLSTDCVFSGDDEYYHEKSVPDGKTLYGRTKILGEINDLKNLTFRNSIIGPDIDINGIGLFNWFMKQKKSIVGYKNVIWSGVTTLTLAKAIDEAIEQNICGIYHLVNNNNINKFELLSLFNTHFNKKLKIYENIEKTLNKSLINNRKDFNFTVPTYENMIIEMKLWMDVHNKTYKHYYEVI